MFQKIRKENERNMCSKYWGPYFLGVIRAEQVATKDDLKKNSFETGMDFYFCHVTQAIDSSWMLKFH